jgi:hypothetical protein
MKLRLSILAILMLVFVAACDGGLPPTEIIIEVESTREVTREVTRVVMVTVDPSQSGPLPVESSVTPEETSEATEAADATAEVSAARTTTAPTATVNLTPSITPTVDPFPTPVTGQIYVAEQVFQRGRMFWLNPINQIWVITTNDDGELIWQIYQDEFEEGMPESEPDFAPTEPGLLQPIRGFGLLWRENDVLRAQLGWAIADEVGYLANYEYHYGGTLDANNTFVQGSGYHIIEALSREVYRFNEGTWDWEVLEQEE